MKAAFTILTVLVLLAARPAAAQDSVDINSGFGASLFAATGHPGFSDPADGTAAAAIEPAAGADEKDGAPVPEDTQNAPLPATDEDSGG